MDRERLYEIRFFARCLANGVDPTSNIKFPEDTVLNLERIKAYNKDVCELIDAMLVGWTASGKRKKRKIPFFMLKDDKMRFEYSEDEISISNFTQKINECSLPEMQKLHAKDITAGLVRLGYLQEVDIDEEKQYKTPTKLGMELGIKSIKKTNSYGNVYGVNLYDRKAQEFIILNLEKIIQPEL